MAGISPTIGSAQHPMIRRRLRLAEVRMSALDGLTLLPFPRLPCDTNSRRGCIADTGRGIWPSSDVSIEGSFFFFIFFLFSKSLEMDRSRLSGWFKKKKWKEKFFLNQIYNNMSKFEFCFNSIRSLLMELCIKIFLFENIPNIFRVALSKIRRFSWLRINCRSKFSIVCI